METQVSCSLQAQLFGVTVSSSFWPYVKVSFDKTLKLCSVALVYVQVSNNILHGDQ